MGKVNVLDKHTAELIAAGEVVERPASVIKELVENAIDACADSVTVEIKDGGTTFIRVADSGEGIAREDVPVAFLRHATSKIKHAADLDGIITLGFRGEALASICAVAKVEVFTRTQAELAGTHYVIEGGEEKLCEDAGCPVGTTIIVRDIFYNTPARMKFLKKNVSEANAVAAILDRIALSHPEISVNFIRDGKEELSTPGKGDLKSCIYAVHGKQFADGLIPVDYELDNIGIKGFISQPHNARSNRTMQHFFINGRYVKSRTMQVALEEGCRGSVMVGKFPSCVLDLKINTQAVDVNVHPAKTEVRFENEKPIFNAVYHAVKCALNKGERKPEIELKDVIMPITQPVKVTPLQTGSIKQAPVIIPPTKAEPKPKEEWEPEIKDIMPPKPVFGKAIRSNPVFKDSGENNYKITIHQEEIKEEKIALPEKPIFIEEKVSEPEPEKIVLPESERPEYKIIGEAFDTYIIVQCDDELMLIDKHAAHERIIYEQLKSAEEDSRQMLLMPVTVRLEKSEYNAVLENLDILDSAGFEVEDFGAGCVIVRAVPMALAGTDIESQITEIAGYLIDNKNDISTKRLDWIYHSVACRAAVKAGDISSEFALKQLVETLMDNTDIRHCPHGRPVAVILTEREIEKKFGRV